MAVAAPYDRYHRPLGPATGLPQPALALFPPMERGAFCASKLAFHGFLSFLYLFEVKYFHTYLGRENIKRINKTCNSDGWINR